MNNQQLDAFPAKVENLMQSIPLDRYLELLDKEAKLQALEMAGVDNWEGYDFAMEILWSDEEE